MKRGICAVLAVLVLTVFAGAAEQSQSLLRALPGEASRLLEDAGVSEAGSLGEGLGGLVGALTGKVRDIVKERIGGAVSILLVVILCGMVEGVFLSAGGSPERSWTVLAGALSIALLSAGSLDSLIGLGRETIDALSGFSRTLLPALAAATAAAGAVGTASVQQVTTVLFADLLVQLIHQILLPMVYLYIGLLTASAMLREQRLSGLAEGLKKGITWLLSAAMLGFTAYLSVARVISGAADTAAVKVARAAISGAVPVVGGILSDVTETVLAGAGVMKGSIGVLGTLAVLAVCAYPFLQLGVQYLLYKLTAFLADTVGAPELRKLIDGLGGAFGLVLGMTGACALVLLISILSSVAAVSP